MHDNTSMPDHAISIKGLSKTYKGNNKTPEKKALQNVNLDIPRGSLFGLLGPNGAGKSTMINILAGLVLKTEGDVSIWGINIDKEPRNAKAAIGIVPQELNIDPFFTPRALLNIHAGMYGVPKSERKTDEILEMIGLKDKENAYARTLSGGMRRRLLIGKAMVHTPPILVLDEPTAGVDIELCDEIAIINHGQVVAHDKKRALLGRLDNKAVRVTLGEDLSDLPESLKSMGAELLTEQDGPTLVRLAYRPSETNAGEVISAINESGLTIKDISTEESNLEDLFLQMTRRPS